MLQVIECDEEEVEWAGRQATRWHYRLTDGIDPDALNPKSVPDLSVRTPNPEEGGEQEQDRPCLPTDISGTDPRDDANTCRRCGDPLPAGLVMLGRAVHAEGCATVRAAS